MKLWEKEIRLDKAIEAFTIGNDRTLDLALARYDVQGTLAHITMLTEVGLLHHHELADLRQALLAIYANIESGGFTIDEGVEDVHSQLELLLTQQLGEVGKKVHSARSRNDQVLVDLRLFFRDTICDFAHLVRALFRLLQARSETYRNYLLPGYTHLQVAMPSSFGLWFGGYAESLADDLRLLLAAYQIINQNPLGSAAGYGSSFPIHRQRTTHLLGFADLCYNVTHAQMGRGKSELVLAFAMANLAATIGKLAMDVCLYNGQNFGFVVLDDAFTTGSSIMPHKKNPDVFELLRGRCHLLQALPSAVLSLTGGLPSGYHRDFQLLKEALFPAIDQLRDVLRLTHHACAHLVPRADILTDDRYRLLFSVESVNRLVLEGVPFRDAYRRVAHDIQMGNYQPDTDLRHTHEGSIGNLCTDHIAAKFDAVFAQFDFATYQAAIAELMRG